MSLLMKALEKAHKDRVDSNGDPAAPADPGPGAANAELSLQLQPLTAPAAPPAAAPSAPAPPPRTPSAGAVPPRDVAQAAAMIRAGQRESGGNLFAYLRDRPWVVIGTLATLFIIGFGGYVYMELNPGLFAAKPAPRPAPSAAIAPPPAPVTASPANVTGSVPAAPPPLTSLLLPSQQVAEKEKPAAPPPAAAVAAAPVAVAPKPAVPVSSSPRDTIKITAGSATPTVNPVLAEAYGALSAGNLESSQRLYNQLIKADSRNVEALLGLAAIATQQGDRDAAARQYVKVIEIDPRNALAQAGLIGMGGRADPQSAETRVKQLIARDPTAAFLHFTLGNTYVDQNRWPDAQQAFFQAHHLQPDNPDYAYNLAVALEHIGQPRPALDFYRRAVLLAGSKGRANFSTAAAQDRVAKLEKIVQ